MNTCYLFILASRNNEHLRVKVTSDLRHGVRNERVRLNRSLGRKRVYQKVVYIESFPGLTSAVLRQREVSDWTLPRLRRRITRFNPRWKPVSVTGYLRRLKAVG